MGNRTFTPEQREKLLEMLAEGKFLKEIERDPDMPSARTIQLWANAGDEFAEEIQLAREVGAWVAAEGIVDEMRNCDDAQKARNILEATKWRLGHISRVFAQKSSSVGVLVNVDADSTFDAFAGLLEAASARLSSRRQSTYVVDGDGTARPIGTRNRLPDLASDGGPGVREDEDRG